MRRTFVLIACVWSVLSAPIAEGDIGRGATPVSSRLWAGAGATDITPPIGTPLAGYGGGARRLLVPDFLNRHPYAFWLKPSRGVHDPIMARALILQSDERRVLWITVDLIATDPEMVSELKDRLATLGLRYDALILSASHTHSGPGAFSRSRLFGVIALDRMVPAVREGILQGMVRAARRAEQGKVVARVGVGRGEVTGLTRSRVRLPLDPEIGVLKVVRPNGQPIALLWNFAIHGTALGKRNLLFSGDISGTASQELERALGVPALYTNGAVGDVSPARRGWPGVQETAEALSREVLATWERISVESTPRFRALSKRIALPPPRLSLKNCLGRWIPSWFTVGIGWGLPRESEMVGLVIGGSTWVTIPGELQTRLGQAVKAEGRRLSGHTFVVGVSNGYAGYFLTPEEYRKPSYVACASLYGDTGGEIVTGHATTILRRLRDAADVAVGAR